MFKVCNFELAIFLTPQVFIFGLYLSDVYMGVIKLCGLTAAKYFKPDLPVGDEGFQKPPLQKNSGKLCLFQIFFYSFNFIEESVFFPPGTRVESALHL